MAAGAGTAAVPTVEQGATMNPGLAGWDQFYDEFERTEKLRWPSCLEVFADMLPDPQVNALRMASDLPVRRRRWLIDPNGAPDEMAERLAADLGLPILGQDAGPRRRTRGRFSWSKFLPQVQLARVYGHYGFERTYDKDTHRLAKVSPRPPSTIQQIKVDEHGDLQAVVQNLRVGVKPIPAAALLWFVWDQEGGNLTGRSALRSLYRPWLIKDRLWRIDAINHERAGGIILLEGQKDADGEDLGKLTELAQSIRVSDSGGAGIPSGVKPHLLSASGGKVVESIRYCDEAMARAWLAMFLQLGQTETGSRALGDGFIDFFALATDGYADGLADDVTEQLVEPWVDVQYGEGVELTPRIVSERNEDPELTVSDLGMLVEKGVIVVDEELEDSIRGRYGLPDRTSSRPTAAAPAVVAEVERERNRRRAAQGVRAEFTVPDRDLRREPKDFEVRAAVDFDAMEATYVTALEDLVAAWKDVRAEQIAELAAIIEAAGGDVAALAEVQAGTRGAETIAAALRTMASQGIDGALAEASAQGASVGAPDIDGVMGGLEARADATATLLARSLSEAAGRKAIALTGGSLSPADVAEQVTAYIESLSDAYLEEQFTGLLTQGQNTGRRAVMAEGEPKVKELYASELLDTNTCEACTGVDGTSYVSLEEAEADYPTGGFKDCQGGPRCRGTLVALYSDEVAPSVE